MYIYIHDTVIPYMLYVMSNGTTKDMLLESYGLKTICQETVGECLIKIGFKYNYDVNNNYVGDHKNNDTICYRRKFIDSYLIIEQCMFRWIKMEDDESDKYKGYQKEN